MRAVGSIIKGIPLFGRMCFFAQMNHDTSFEHISEFLSLVGIVRISGPSCLQMQTNGFHAVLLRIGNNPLNPVAAFSVLFYKIIFLRKNNLLLHLFLCEKLTDGSSQSLQNVFQSRDRRRRHISLQLRNKTFGKLGPVSQLLLCQTLSFS